MDKPLGTLEIIKSQRDRLAVAYHDLQVEHTLLKESLRMTSELLETLQASEAMKRQVAEFEQPMINKVGLADHAVTDASA